MQFFSLNTDKYTKQDIVYICLDQQQVTGNNWRTLIIFLFVIVLFGLEKIAFTPLLKGDSIPYLRIINKTDYKLFVK